MPDEVSMSVDAEETEVTPSIVHDDIMQRLLEYQRQLREGMTPEEAAESVSAPVPVDDAGPPWPAATTTPSGTAEVIDLAAVEEPVEMEPAPADAPKDLTARLAELEDTLASVANSISDLRAQLQNMAITADDRLSGIESALSGAQDAAANGILMRASNTISRLLYSDRSGR